MTEIGLEFFATQNFYGLCSEVLARIVFLSNIFLLTDSSVLGSYVVLSAKELPVF